MGGSVTTALFFSMADQKVSSLWKKILFNKQLTIESFAMKPYFLILVFFLNIGIPREGYSVQRELLISLFKVLQPWMMEKNSYLKEGALPPKILETFNEVDIPFKNLNSIAQKFFLRPSGTERIDVLNSPQDPFLKEKTPELMLLFEKMGFLTKIDPPKETL